MDEKRFHDILRGNFRHIPKEKSKIVRIFLSSTFSGNSLILYFFYMLDRNFIH